MNKIPDLLFREVSLLKLIGFSAAQIKEGSCKRGKGHSIPINKNTLSRMLERLSILEVNKILSLTVKSLAKRNFLKSSVFVMDATDIPTTEKCEGSALKRVKTRKYDKTLKKFVEKEKTLHGFKLIVVWEVKSRIVAAAKVVKISDHESKKSFFILSVQYLRCIKKYLQGWF